MVDKLYIMLPEFTKTVKSGKLSFEKIKYDMNKPASEQSLAARNNLLIDLMWGVLTHPDTASKMLNPGGFEYHKKAARITDILTTSSSKELMSATSTNSVEAAIDKLFSMNLDELNAILDSKQVNPLSPITQINLHANITNGGNLIGIYANHNANHAIIQHTELRLKEDATFTLNGKTLTSLHEMQNNASEFISRNNAGFLAASVDNVKDPILASMNQNTFTADIAMLLSRLGYNPLEISVFLNQPIIVEITNSYFKNSKSGMSTNIIVEEILEKYKKKANLFNASYENYKNNQFLLKDLAKNIVISKNMKNIQTANQTADYDEVSYYQNQVAVGYLFNQILKSSNALSRFVQVTRSDTERGANGPTIADTIIKIKRIQDFITDSVEESFPLLGTDVIDMYTPNEQTSKDEIRERLLSSKLPFLQAFTSLGLLSAQTMLAKYFPHYKTTVMATLDSLRLLTKSERLNVKTINNIFNDYFAYIASGIDFFGTDSKSPSIKKREKFINDFPNYFKKVITENQDIADLEFIKRLKLIRANAYNPVDTIVFKNVGSLSPRLREVYQRDWASLLYMPNPEAQKLALNLFLYSYYRNGFAFGPSTFIHLAPVAIRKAIPQYVDWLYSTLKDDNSDDPDINFVKMYVRNHLDNRTLVPEIKEGTSVKFFTEEKEPVDEFTISIEKNSSQRDKQFARKTTVLGEYYIVEPLMYIAVKYKNDFIYFQLDVDKADSGNTFTYKRIEPLGFKNSFIEYDVYEEADDMKTAIVKKQRKQKELQNPEDFDAFDTPEMTPEECTYFNEDGGLSNAEILQQYGYTSNSSDPMDNPDGVSRRDFTAIQPNNDWQDDTDNIVCRF
jgi:hypothetical protein